MFVCVFVWLVARLCRYLRMRLCVCVWCGVSPLCYICVLISLVGSFVCLLFVLLSFACRAGVWLCGCVLRCVCLLVGVIACLRV